MSIELRRAQPSDAAAFAQMMQSPEIYPMLLQLPYASEEIWRQRLTEQTLPGKSDLHLVALRNGELLGSAGLHPVGQALRRRHAMSLGISVRPEFRGQGVGQALLGALLDYADNWAQVLRVELEVYCDNETAVRLYQRNGFEIEGRMKAHALRAGRYVDSYVMGRLHPNPPQLR